MGNSPYSYKSPNYADLQVDTNEDHDFYKNFDEEERHDIDQKIDELFGDEEEDQDDNQGKTGSQTERIQQKHEDADKVDKFIDEQFDDSRSSNESPLQVDPQNLPQNQNQLSVINKWK